MTEPDFARILESRSSMATIRSSLESTREHQCQDDLDSATTSFIELLRSPACLLDETGTVLYLNETWRTYAGLSNETCNLGPWVQLIEPEDHYKVLACFCDAAGDGKFATFQCRLIDFNNESHWFILNIHSTINGKWLCTCTDIHKLKYRERELEKHASIQTDMLNVSVDCIKLISLDGSLVYMNRAGCRALGVPEDSRFGMPWLPLLPSDVWASGEQALAVARSGACSRFPGRSVMPGQKAQYWDNMLTPVKNTQGEVTGILCVSREVTAEYEARGAIEQNQKRLAIAARVGGLGIWDYDIQLDELHCDETWYGIMGRDRTRPIQSIADFRPLIHPDDVHRATEVRQTAEELIAAGLDYGMEYRIIRPNGDVRWVRSAAFLQHEAGVPVRAIGLVVDITDSRRGEMALRDANRVLEEEKVSLTRQSLEDPLTGIANRRCLDDELLRICSPAYTNDRKFCIGIVDVDHFKAFNDRYGHPAGDSALRKIAMALKSFVRDSDFVARYGGEEFVFILDDTDDPTPALDRLKNTIADLAVVHEKSPTGFLTMSCGCAVFEKRSIFSPTQLLKESDETLYEAKMMGRNRYVVRMVQG